MFILSASTVLESGIMLGPSEPMAEPRRSTEFLHRSGVFSIHRPRNLDPACGSSSTAVGVGDQPHPDGKPKSFENELPSQAMALVILVAPTESGTASRG